MRIITLAKLPREPVCPKFEFSFKCVECECLLSGTEVDLLPIDSVSYSRIPQTRCIVCGHKADIYTPTAALLREILRYFRKVRVYKHIRLAYKRQELCVLSELALIFYAWISPYPLARVFDFVRESNVAEERYVIDAIVGINKSIRKINTAWDGEIMGPLTKIAKKRKR